MHRGSFSGHIPDPHQITFHAERGGTFVHRIDPWVKAAALAWLVLLVTLARSTWLLLSAYALTIIVYRAAGLPLRELARWSTVPALFVLSLLLILVWGEPGRPLLGFGGLVLTDGGLLLALSLLFRALTTVTFTLTLLMTTRYSHLARMASILLPNPIDQVCLLSYRFLLTTTDMIGDLLVALRSRGGGLARGIATRSRLFAAIFGLSFIRAYDRAERVGRAMEARGYRGRLTPLEPIPRPGPVETFAVGIAFLGLFMAVLTGQPGFGGGAA
ncbi:MAG TPA: cobalt ECF transporter T component CbiQ [Methanoregulaceae archaeon]|nr:cobalt ECF transporter T component CbiQ [Methanoregulaceae archaeon]